MRSGRKKTNARRMKAFLSCSERSSHTGYTMFGNDPLPVLIWIKATWAHTLGRRGLRTSAGPYCLQFNRLRNCLRISLR